MKLKVTKPFDFAHRGCEVKHYAKGEEIDTDTADPELVKVGTDEGWIAKPRVKTDGAGGKEPSEPQLPDDPATDAAAKAQAEQGAAGGASDTQDPPQP